VIEAIAKLMYSYILDSKQNQLTLF
jgi:hypothetical protein